MRFIPNEHGIEDLFRDPHGPIGRDLSRRALNVESAAKLNASGRPGPNVQTGRLRSSITHVIIEDPERGLVARIGSNVEYARFVEMGTDRAPPYPYLRPALSAAQP